MKKETLNLQDFSFQEINLIATYENAFDIPAAQRVSYYFGDYGSHFLKVTSERETVLSRLQAALEVLGLSREELNSIEKYIWRENIIKAFLARGVKSAN